MQCFAEDVDAATTARLCLVNRKTVNAWYGEIRRRLLPYSTGLPALTTAAIRGFKIFHSRRTSKFYGIGVRKQGLHLAESRLRFEYKSSFRSVVLEAVDSLLD